MNFLHKIVFLASIICILLISLTSCGRYSEPSPIKGSNYPHNYPQR